MRSSLPRLAKLPLGGTAVGTGINTPPGFAAKVIEWLAESTGLPLTEARDHFEAQSARDGLVEASGQLRTIAIGLYKIVNDLRWMGFRAPSRAGRDPAARSPTGLVEHARQGKSGGARGGCHGVRAGRGQRRRRRLGWRRGVVELNVMLPMLARNLLEAIRLLANGSRLLADRCIDGIEADVERNREYAESSPSIVTPLNRYIGYENAAAVAIEGARRTQDHPGCGHRGGVRQAR